MQAQAFGAGGGPSRNGLRQASEERASSSRPLRPRTTAGWTPAAANTRRTGGRLGSKAHAGAARASQPAAVNPGSAPTSSLIAVLLVAKSERGSQIVFQWPPKPHFLNAGLAAGSPHRGHMPDAPSGEARKKRAWDTYLGYENSFLAELLTPRRDLCHQKFELAVDDLVFVGHPVCADDREGWALNSNSKRAGAFEDPDHDADLMSRGRAPRSNRFPNSDFPNPAYAAGERSPFDPSPRSGSYSHLQQLPPSSRSQIRQDSSFRSAMAEAGGSSNSLSSFHFVLVLDKPDPAPPYLPPGMSSIISASQLNAFNIDPNLIAQLYYDNIAFKMTAALYNEQCSCAYVSQQASYLERKREASKSRGRRFVDFMKRMRERDGSLAKAMADLFESLSKNEGALITINNRIETHLQLPPILRETRRMLFSADLETERDMFEGQRGMASFEWEQEHGAGLYDTATNHIVGGYGHHPALDPQAYLYEEWRRTTGPHLVPWKTLLMLKNHKAETAPNRKPTGLDKPIAAKQHRRGESRGSLMSRSASIAMSAASGSGSGSRNSHSNLNALRSAVNTFGQTYPGRSMPEGAEMNMQDSAGSSPDSRWISSAASVEDVGESDEDGPEQLASSSSDSSASGSCSQASHTNLNALRSAVTFFGQSYSGRLTAEGAEMSMQNSAGSGSESRRMSSTASVEDDGEGDEDGPTRLLGSLAIEGDSIFAGDKDLVHLEARGIEAWIPRFATELEPKLDGIPTLKELAVNLNWDLYQDVYPMVRHLIYYREARVIDVPFITNIYSISPLVDTANLPQLLQDWQNAFPTLPSLVRVLSQLSSSAHPFEKQLDSAGALSFPVSPALNMDLNARQELYLDALFWLLRAELIVQLQYRHRIVVTEDLKRQARHRREREKQQRQEERQAKLRARDNARAQRAVKQAAKRMAAEKGAPSSFGPKSFEPASHRSTISNAQQRIADELAVSPPRQLHDGATRPGAVPNLAFGPMDDVGADGDESENDAEGDGRYGEEDVTSSDGEDWEWQDDEPGPTLVAEPGNPTQEEKYCLEMMMEGLPSDLEAVFQDLEEIVSRRDLSFDKLRSLMRKRAQYFIAFLHP
ncbi:Nitrogen permease regulator 3 [Tilletia horrida]|nr:Nitrogen permease regulator 3 [Tilletia horrida]